jgi:hydrogenase expression/formation protein HypC
MCLAVPGQVVKLRKMEPPFSTAIVDFGGIRREVSTACVPGAVEGDYVLVHAGVAISRIDADEAARVFDVLRELNLTEPEYEVNGMLETGVRPR